MGATEINRTDKGKEGKVTAHENRLLFPGKGEESVCALPRKKIAKRVDEQGGEPIELSSY